MAAVLKVEPTECCGVCGGGGDLRTPEEHDLVAKPMQPPLRAMLAHLNNNKPVEAARICGGCVKRTADAFALAVSLQARDTPPLSERIRALRKRLRELTSKIDVFVVVGAGKGGQYSEDDIIMVERAALEAASDADAERAQDARGEPVYQCSVCPLSFSTAGEWREHLAKHPSDSRHSCWTCSAQFDTRAQLAQHSSEQHAAAQPLLCRLCDTSLPTSAALASHEAACAATCPACGAACGDRAGLSAHVTRAHSRGAPPPLVCSTCFALLPTADTLSAHALTHKQRAHFVCGYDNCILRFGTRSNLMAHIRRCHAAAAPPEEDVKVPAPGTSERKCPHCDRICGSAGALTRHVRAQHTQSPPPPMEETSILPTADEDDKKSVLVYSQEEEIFFEEDGLVVEYLDEAELMEDDEIEYKPDISRL